MLTERLRAVEQGLQRFGAAVLQLFGLGLVMALPWLATWLPLTLASD